VLAELAAAFAGHTQQYLLAGHAVAHADTGRRGTHSCICEAHTAVLVG